MPERGSMSAGAGFGGGSSVSDRTDSDRSDNNRGGAREKKETFERTMSASGEPPAETRESEGSLSGMTGSERLAASETLNHESFGGSLAEAKTQSEGAAGSSSEGGDGATASVTAPEAPETPEAEEDRGVFDRVGDFFSGLATGMQNFARENPRVDADGNPIGYVGADGIQRGPVTSRMMASGRSPAQLAERLGFSSPQEMAAAQNTDFIDDRYQEDSQKRAIEQTLSDRRGHPASIPGLDFNPYAMGFAPEADMLTEDAYFGDVVFDEQPRSIPGVFETGWNAFVNNPATPVEPMGEAPSEASSNFLDDAYEFGQDFLTRSLGLAQMAGGVAEIGVGGLLSSTGPGAAVGIPLGLHGADNLRAGFETWQTGAFQPTLTEQMLNEGLSGVGVNPGIAGSAAIAADAVIGMANPGAAFRNTGEVAIRQLADQVVPEMASRYATHGVHVTHIDPAELHFSQTTAGGNGGAAFHRADLANGWTHQPPVDVVRMSDGRMVTIDNTRPAVARELGISEIPVRVHDTFDPLPSDMADRFGKKSETWGDAVQFRASGQKPRLDLDGTLQAPKLPSPMADR